MPRRRAFMRKLGAAGIGSLAMLGGESAAARESTGRRTVGDRPDEETEQESVSAQGLWPITDVEKQSADSPTGNYRFHTVASSLVAERADPVYHDGKWRYVYHSSASATALLEDTRSGDMSLNRVYGGQELLEVQEQDYPGQISTRLIDDADWGMGLVGDDGGNTNRMADAVVDSFFTLAAEKANELSTVYSLMEVVNQINQAGQNPRTDDGIFHEWDHPSRLPQAKKGHFAQYDHLVPPREEIDRYSVFVDVRNKIRGGLYEEYVDTTGNDIPTGEYEHTFTIILPVMYRPSSMSSAERSEYGIEKRRAKNVGALSADSPDGPDLDEDVYVATDAPVEVQSDS